MILILLIQDKFGDVNAKKLSALKDIVNVLSETKNAVPTANVLIAKIKNKKHQ